VAVSAYVALLQGGRREERVGVRRLAPGAYEVTLLGQTHRVDALRHDHGTLSLIVDTESYSVQIDERGTGVKVHLRDSVFALEILDERRLRMRRAAGKFTVSGRQHVASRLPGRVVRVLRHAGDEVREGEGVVVVELMGMENEIRSPKAGKVLEVFAKEGLEVEGGATLATVE
jgi:biotin carboxyl carrier protein